MDGDGMITKDELKKLVEKVCKTYFSDPPINTSQSYI